MPLYEYECGHCGHVTEAVMPMDDRDPSVPCEKCGNRAGYVISAPLVEGENPSWATKRNGRWDRRGVAAVAQIIQDPSDVVSGRERPIETRSDLKRFEGQRAEQNREGWMDSCGPR